MPIISAEDFAKRAGLYFALRSRVLTDEEMDAVEKLDVHITAPEEHTTPWDRLEKTQEFLAALLQQFRLRAEATKAVRIAHGVEKAAKRDPYAEELFAPYRLCYVREGVAWFTSKAPFHSQDGSCWNKTPYEHNAGAPYEWGPEGVPYSLVKLSFIGEFTEPNHGHLNSPYSVRQINERVTGEAGPRIAWVSSAKEPQMYGLLPCSTISEFIRFIIGHGGKVFYELAARIRDADTLLAAYRAKTELEK